MPLLFTDRGGKRSLGREEKRRNMRSRKAPEPPFRKPGETPPRGRNDAGADTAADRKTPLPRGGKDVRPDRHRHNRLAPDIGNLRDFDIIRRQRLRRGNHVNIKLRRPGSDKQHIAREQPLSFVKFGIQHRHRNRGLRRCLAVVRIRKIVVIARTGQADVRPARRIDKKCETIAEVRNIL